MFIVADDIIKFWNMFILRTEKMNERGMAEKGY